MKLAKTLLVTGSVLALAAGSALADSSKAKDDPGFNALDKNHDGSLSRSEALANPTLAKNFNQADKNNDGKLSRTEYLTFMTKKDLSAAKNKVTNTFSHDKDKSSASGGTKSDK